MHALYQGLIKNIFNGMEVCDIHSLQRNREGECCANKEDSKGFESPDSQLCSYMPKCPHTNSQSPTPSQQHPYSSIRDTVGLGVCLVLQLHSIMQ